MKKVYRARCPNTDHVLERDEMPDGPVFCPEPECQGRTATPVLNFEEVKIPSVLDRFYALYLEGRKNGTPQNYISYHDAAHFLMNEVREEDWFIEKTQKE